MGRNLTTTATGQERTLFAGAGLGSADASRNIYCQQCFLIL